MNYVDIIKNGIVKENPTFVLMLGMCPTLATTTSAMNGMSMGLATMAVLICTNVVISCLKSVTPDKVRIPVFIVVIASLSGGVIHFVVVAGQEIQILRIGWISHGE